MIAAALKVDKTRSKYRAWTMYCRKEVLHLHFAVPEHDETYCHGGREPIRFIAVNFSQSHLSHA
jgi:hypothetical protein